MPDIDQQRHIRGMCSYMANYDFPYCPNVKKKYEILGPIGGGTYGDVFKAREKAKPDQLVALKELKIPEMASEGFPIFLLREINNLKHLEHVNIVKIVEVCMSVSEAEKRLAMVAVKYYMVLELCDQDLAGILKNRQVEISEANIKAILKQFFEGLYYLHQCSIMHRDLKPANVLMTKRGVLKLADFGLSKAISNRRPTVMTTGMVTAWYRPPEILLGDKGYAYPADMWSAGCIMAEMWTRSPILKGQSEQHQLRLITETCGPINTTTWPSVKRLPLYDKIRLPHRDARPARLAQVLGGLLEDPNAFGLLERLLRLDPSKRIDAEGALNHDYFWWGVKPGGLEEMLGQRRQRGG